MFSLMDKLDHHKLFAQEIDTVLILGTSDDYVLIGGLW